MSLNGHRHCCCYCCYCYCCCIFFYFFTHAMRWQSSIWCKETSLNQWTHISRACNNVYHQEKTQAQTERMSSHKGAAATYLSTRSTERPVRLNVLSAKNTHEGTRPENTPSRDIRSHVRLHWDYAIYQGVSLNGHRYCCCYCCYCYCCCTFFFRACDEVTELDLMWRDKTQSVNAHSQSF